MAQPHNGISLRPWGVGSESHSPHLNLLPPPTQTIHTHLSQPHNHALPSSLRTHSSLPPHPTPPQPAPHVATHFLQLLRGRAVPDVVVAYCCIDEGQGLHCNQVTVLMKVILGCGGGGRGESVGGKGRRGMHGGGGEDGDDLLGTRVQSMRVYFTLLTLMHD